MSERSGSLRQVLTGMDVARIVRFWIFLGLMAPLSQSAFTAERIYLRLTVILSDLEGDQLVPGLKREDFQVSYQGVPQYLEYFSAAPSPSSVVVLLDMDGSMQTIDLSRVLNELIKICNVQSVPDEISLIAYSNRSSLLKSFGWRVKNIDFKAVLERVRERDSSSQPGTLGALHLAEEMMRSKARNHNQAIVLVTDAEENFSYSTTVEIQNQISKMGVRVYGVFFPGKNRLDYGRWHNLVLASGGRYFQINEPGPVELILRWFLHELRYQYVLGFTPGSISPPLKKSHISVRLAEAEPDSGLSIRFTSAKGTGRIRRGGGGR